MSKKEMKERIVYLEIENKMLRESLERLRAENESPIKTITKMFNDVESEDEVLYDSFHRQDRG